MTECRVDAGDSGIPAALWRAVMAARRREIVEIPGPRQRTWRQTVRRIRHGQQLRVAQTCTMPLADGPVFRVSLAG